MSNTVQILANIGVIASIVFLSIQVRQNNALLGVQLRGDSLER